MADTKYTPRLKTEYQDRIRGALKEKFGYTNEMQIPKLDKIVLNMGIGEAVADSKKATAALKDLTAIAGQKAVPTKARNSIAGFKLREGMIIGGKVTHIVFPEINYDQIDQMWGMDIIVCTTAKTDEEAKALLTEFKFPFVN